MARGHFRVEKTICLYCGSREETRRVARNLFLCEKCTENSGYIWYKSTKLEDLKKVKLSEMDNIKKKGDGV